MYNILNLAGEAGVLRRPASPAYVSLELISRTSSLAKGNKSWHHPAIYGTENS